MIKIKICGLTRIVDIALMNEVIPDYIGFVFAKSRRQVTEDIAMELKQKLSPGIQTVGVFVNDDPQRMIQLCKVGMIDIIQLHGDEDEEKIKVLKAAVPNPIIKAVRVRNTSDILEAASLPCDYLLLDAYKEDQYGGSGEKFDWSLVSDIKKPFFLAGGISSDNVTSAMQLTRPYCIDVSSGVETNGFKDSKKVKEMIGKVRGMSQRIS